jgi:hypothetical protein
VAQKNGLEYLQGTAEGMEMVMCDWPSFYEGRGSHLIDHQLSLSLSLSLS